MSSLSVDVTTPRSVPKAVAENDLLPSELKIFSRELLSNHTRAPSCLFTPFMIGTLRNVFFQVQPFCFKLWSPIKVQHIFIYIYVIPSKEIGLSEVISSKK